MPLLEITNLNTRFETLDGTVSAVNDVSFSLEPGETLGIVGESGSGKSQLVLSIMNLLATNGTFSGSILLGNQELIGLPPKRMNRIRGDRIAMIFQDPMTCLNGYLTIATQMTEVLVLHKGMDRKRAKIQAVEMLEAVHIPDARNQINRYPHEFSGGMRQRVMIAMALLCEPDLLIADEPTTALDVTVQAQIIALMNELQSEMNMSIIMITHDLGVIAGISDNVMVMYAGKICEYGSVEHIFKAPAHPYTRGLLRSVPRLDITGQETLQTIPGNPPNLLHISEGCPFFGRCEQRQDICRTTPPPRRGRGAGQYTICHLESS